MPGRLPERGLERSKGHLYVAGARRGICQPGFERHRSTRRQRTGVGEELPAFDDDTLAIYQSCLEWGNPGTAIRGIDRHALDDQLAGLSGEVVRLRLDQVNLELPAGDLQVLLCTG